MLASRCTLLLPAASLLARCCAVRRLRAERARAIHCPLPALRAGSKQSPPPTPPPAPPSLTISPSGIFAYQAKSVSFSGQGVANGDTVVFLLAGDASGHGALQARSRRRTAWWPRAL